MRSAFVLLALAAALACTRKPYDDFDDRAATSDEDATLTARAVGEYRRRIRPSSDAAAVARLARVSGRLLDAAKAGRGAPRATTLAWEIVLAESPDSNVAVFANGTIFVDAGLLRILDDDDALAGALGQAIVRPLMRGGGGRRGWRRVDTSMLGFDGGTSSRVDRASRETEEADYAGLTLAVDAGYDPERVVAVFDRLGLRARGEAAREHLPALRERHAER